MNSIKITSIILTLSLSIGSVYAAEEVVNSDENISVTLDTNVSVANDDNATLFDDANATKVNDENLSATDDMNITMTDDANVSVVDDANTTLSEDGNITVEKRVLSEFEKLFLNHSAYLYYLKGIEDLYNNNYKGAYENALSAKAIYDNTEVKEQIIPLPYMPGYLRESAYRPKRIYYKMLLPKTYELKRLIVKAKLMSPPIPSIVIKRTSTYMDVIVRNYGDLPLDEFKILLNDEVIATYETILPNEEKLTRIESAPSLYEISFEEKYGFAPNSSMLSEDE